jgi:hypothetical protein
LERHSCHLFLSQALWLHFAYQHEFLSVPRFTELWASSSVMMAVYTYILGELSAHYQMSLL